MERQERKGFFGRLREQWQKSGEVIDIRLMEKTKRWVEEALATTGDARKNTILGTVRKLQGLARLKPSIAYFINFQIGTCALALDDYNHALECREAALLSHPGPESPNLHLGLYIGGYLEVVRTISQQEGIRNLHKRDKKNFALNRLQLVVESTRRILERFPHLDGVRQEHFAAHSWLQKGLGRPVPDYRRIGKN